MQIELQVRAAEQSDLQLLLELYRQLNPSDPLLSLQDADRIWRQFLKYSGSEIFIGVAGGTLVTTCALAVIPNHTRGGAPYGLIENVVTDVRHRRKGYLADTVATVNRAIGQGVFR